MQRYYLTLLIVLLFWSGCSLKSPKINNSAKIDGLLIQTAFLESNGYFVPAASMYEKLYKMTGAKLFLIKTIENYYRAKRFDKALKYAHKGMKLYPKESRFYELAAVLYIQKKDLMQAEKFVKEAIKLKKSPQTYELLASIYLTQKRYELALKYYKSAYALKPSATTLSTMAYIMYFYLGKKREAIAYLETHMRIYGCSKHVCHSLASFYGLQNNIDGMISVYKRLYETYKDPQYAKKVIEFLVYQNRINEAIAWAKKTEMKKLLLDLYRMKKSYKEAYQLANELFHETNNYKYLADAAIFEYESASEKNRDLLKDVAQKMERALKYVKNPIYYNFLGYLYIDHDFNIHRGIKLVQKALESNPNSPYFLDSLAWGYYKIGKCKEALKIMKKVYYDFGLKEPEVEYHLKTIQKCVKGKRP
ncbi:MULTISPECIES: tetratricopeptide repeat protein [unclassified Nitratiruptor]|uniref:tetratricopeptide repeat protein n=1 Tax=unclassified Nitratiruptor TaxID=2624044 RepID=UPI0019155E95|nr:MULTISPECIES: tetratricopeptide repeat protein [unclassified Nitratiruptor]BCD60295.1 hypothetical protein NitYY0810_C1060 [Nitratiruptor sp. YY08-10]BCD64215.1 hypothetical protein NitYY0814_C1060 [Nitratiruptor sp. YY08-14]